MSRADVLLGEGDRYASARIAGRGTSLVGAVPCRACALVATAFHVWAPGPDELEAERGGHRRAGREPGSNLLHVSA